MNIEYNFNSADDYLEKAKEKVAAQDYEAALLALAKAYSHVRQLLELVFKLKALKDDVTEPAGKDSGGPQK